MAMPGTPSGENHSSESHTCGLNSMPRRARSGYSRRTCRASGARWSESFRSQKRIASSCSSERRVQRRARARAAILDRRVVDIARKDEWPWRETQQRAYPSARTVSAVRSTGFARRIAGGRPEESRVLAKPRSAADLQQRVREEAASGAFDQLLFDQAVAPGSWDCACSVVRTRERSARRGDHPAVPSRLSAGWIRVRRSTEDRPTPLEDSGLGLAAERGLERHGQRYCRMVAPAAAGPGRAQLRTYSVCSRVS